MKLIDKVSLAVAALHARTTHRTGPYLDVNTPNLPLPQSLFSLAEALSKLIRVVGPDRCAPQKSNGSLFESENKVWGGQR